MLKIYQFRYCYISNHINWYTCHVLICDDAFIISIGNGEPIQINGSRTIWHLHLVGRSIVVFSGLGKPALMGGIKLKSGRISYQVINLAQLETDEKITSFQEKEGQKKRVAEMLILFQING